VVFLDGKVYSVGKIEFVIPSNADRDNWHIRTPDLHQVVLTFTPQSCKKEGVNALILKDRFIQVVGTFRGVIRIGEVLLHVKQLFGVAEEHYALW
jgi:hypothetical protein